MPGSSSQVVLTQLSLLPLGILIVHGRGRRFSTRQAEWVDPPGIWITNLLCWGPRKLLLLPPTAVAWPGPRGIGTQGSECSCTELALCTLAAGAIRPGEKSQTVWTQLLVPLHPALFIQCSRTVSSSSPMTHLLKGPSPTCDLMSVSQE